MVWANARSAHWPTPSLRSLGAAEPPPRPARVLSLGHFLRASARQRRPGAICREGKWAAAIYTQNQLEPVRGSAVPGKKFCGKMGGRQLYTKLTRASARQRRPGEICIEGKCAQRIFPLYKLKKASAAGASTQSGRSRYALPSLDRRRRYTLGEQHLL